ncbi:hypothetical protein CC2G_003278 [Coprinopsis cinerea AmutBmut pab1-1]|nr:hypothetical protein CC2G_003278 [Coprinopsis cinerea AmutBmut pab1-1]
MGSRLVAFRCSPPMLQMLRTCVQRCRRLGSSSRAMFYSTTTIPPPGSDAHVELQQSLPGTIQAHRCHIFLRSDKRPTEFPEKYISPIHRALLLRFFRQGVIANSAWYPDASASDVPAATVFTPLAGRLDIPEVSLENIDAVEKRIKAHLELEGPVSKETGRLVDLYVCTHAARDCRCGEMGGLVAKALREAAEEWNKSKGAEGVRVRVGEVGHVGGHK